MLQEPADGLDRGRVVLPRREQAPAPVAADAESLAAGAFEPAQIQPGLDRRAHPRKMRRPASVLVHGKQAALVLGQRHEPAAVDLDRLRARVAGGQRLDV